MRPRPPSSTLFPYTTLFRSFVVEKAMPGYSVSRALKKTGWWTSDTAELAFDSVRVPVENRLGEEGSGFTSLMRNFQRERLADRKSTRLNSSHLGISYAVFCL